MKLACKTFGAANTRGDIILIHGTGARAEMWSPQINWLESKNWRCIVPDLRGHGESAEPGERTDLKVHMQDLLETVEDFQVRWPAILVGHSLGSIISLELAAAHPELVKAILAVSLPGKVPRLTVSAFRIFLGLPYQNLRGTTIHRSLGWRERVLLETNQHALHQVLENFQDLDYVTDLPSISCPIHLAVGRLDPIAPWKHVETMHKSLPTSTFKVIEWAGHNCMDSQPEAFNRWFESSMDSVSN